MLLFQLTMCGVFLVFDFYGGTKHILAIILPAVLPFLTIAVWLYEQKTNKHSTFSAIANDDVIH